ncbi:uncharacterized protein N7496_006153 [Penicillium cataractarum]|uniref:Uncharacterized protein n=1 Tax=Penicillium cataractarum TaxID=2100454 RepID=A0A9W9V8B9_9EURO|nr:uncharacterized protein N7496_006153 [Penicillium cataractarum]KAJ5370061.1 hypothetical protein N7496_006153 [Penicillium cataractarum]
MYSIRNSMTRAMRAKQRNSVAKLQASRLAQRKFATSPNEIADNRRTPMWLYGTVAAGAVGMLYLWKSGNRNAKAAATKSIPEHHGGIRYMQRRMRVIRVV